MYFCVQELEENSATTCNSLNVPILVHPPSSDAQAQAPKQRAATGASGLAGGGPIVVESTPQVGLLKQFTFTSQMQRMSVLCVHLRKAPGVDSASVETPVLYVKGAPEKIASLSVPHSG